MKPPAGQYGLSKISSGFIRVEPNELLSFSCIRNEIERLPFFLDYYRSKGVDKFFFIDNDSSDGTIEFLLAQKDTYVFHTEQSYAKSRFGVEWIEELLNHYGLEHWCLVVDIDELLVFPGSEEFSLRDVCGFMQSEGSTAMRALLLDMYADGFPSLSENKEKCLWDIFPYFDNVPPEKNRQQWDDIYVGGLRKRIFGLKALLKKFPLIFYTPNLTISAGAHRVNGIQLSAVEGCLLHFKYDQLFVDRAVKESQRGEHWEQAREYKAYVQKMHENPRLVFYDASLSVRYKNTSQLLEMEMMRMPESYAHFFANKKHGCVALNTPDDYRSVSVNLQKLSLPPVSVKPTDVLVFACLRNEIERLPFFLQYYRSKGVNKFLIVDNDSQDGSREFLLSQKDVYLFHTTQSYAQAEYGALWRRKLLNQYGIGNWCVFADIDECLVYPHSENVSIRDLCSFLESEGVDGLKVMMLDMYADGFPALKENQSLPLWKLFPYFDKDSHSVRRENDQDIWFGGVRQRVFGVNACLQKIPLVRYSFDFPFGIHFVENFSLSAVEGSMLHFKYDQSFAHKVREESLRKEHYKNAEEYKKYTKQLEVNPSLNLYDQNHSLEYKNSLQLVELGIMKTSVQYEKFITNQGAVSVS